MKLKKHTKPLAQATVGDLTDHKCGNCGLFLQFEEADLENNIAWLSCPTFIASGGGNDQHSSYSVKLSDTGYKPDDPTTAFPEDQSSDETKRKRRDRAQTMPPQDFLSPPGSGKR